jgi:hypothetical protein
MSDPKSVPLAETGRGAAPAPVRRRRSASRPSILDDVRLTDGRLAWPVAKAAGVSEVTFRCRLKAGDKPDEAIRPVLRQRTDDGLSVAAAARRAGLHVMTVHKRLSRGVPISDAFRSVERPRLADGRLAWPVAKAAGVSSQAFHHRLKTGWSADDAVLPVGAARPPAVA